VKTAFPILLARFSTSQPLPSEGLIPAVAGAILDSDAIDWALVESSAGVDDCSVLQELRLVAAVADFHRQLLNVDSSDGSRASRRDRIPETWGHLRVLERIGLGAYGEVFRAWDTRLDREVALKLLPANSSNSDPHRTSIIEEGRLLARVRHPNVVTIYGAERIENQIGLWMELVKGRTLQQALEQGKTFSTTEAVDIGIELCRAIAAVHGAGLLHRDIKAHNVMLGDDGRVVLMDFGTGREPNDSSTKGLAGTPLYLAPELLSGGSDTVRSDIYSVGVLLYHLLTRTYPVRAQGLHHLRLAHERHERLDVTTLRPDLSRKAARIIERAIDPQPERRYASANSLGADLAALKPRSRVVRLAYATGVAAALILAVTAGWEEWGRQMGSSRTPSALLAGLFRLNHVGATNVNPTAQPVIAVLPLKNLSAEPESDYFVDGLTDEIIRNLAVIQGLQVRSRTSSFAFKDKPRNLPEVGEQLGANLIVEGSVLRAGNRLRVNVQLVQVAGDVPLWAQRFDRELEDVFAIQDEISRAIVNKLRLTLRMGQRRYDPTSIPTVSISRPAQWSPSGR
jgi:TolB-like protein